VERNHRYPQSSRRLFYVDIKDNPLGKFITVYDKEVFENNENFRNKTYTRILSEDDVKDLMKKAVSIILYGENAVKIGIEERFIHPDAVSYQYGVQVAIYIETRRL